MSTRAIAVPGGGLTEHGRLTPWVEERLRVAESMRGSDPIICLSAGTVHKRPPLNAAGYVVTEAAAAADALRMRGVPPQSIWQENLSYDTIGNAYFLRLLHVDVRAIRHLVVVTSDFHMLRTQDIFRWVFGLNPAIDVHLEFCSTAAVGLPPAAEKERLARERESRTRVQTLSQRISSMFELHQYINEVHSAYVTGGNPMRVSGEAATSY